MIMVMFTWVLLLVVGAWAAPEADLVTSLPGWDQEIPFTQYSGYLDGLEGQHMHYWFAGSQRDLASDPVILWLNGGPGCSSAESSLDELGPFFIDQDDEFSLVPNPYSWNLNASVIFLTSPVCVGYSYSDDGNCESDDDTTSMANYMTMKDFFGNKFPELSGNDFYIAGESYGGIYVPTLAQRVVEGLSSFPLEFKGWATGNGMLSFTTDTNSLMFYAYHHGIFDDSLWDRLVMHCCEGGVASKDTCKFNPASQPPMNLNCVDDVWEASLKIKFGGLNPYSLYGDCKTPSENSTSGAPSKMEKMMNHMFQNLKGRFQKIDKGFQDKSSPGLPVPCFDDHIVENWMSRTDVREALHIPDDKDLPEQWTVCSDIPYIDIYENMTSQFQYLNSQKVKGLVYNGDWDMMCNFLGNEWMIENLGFTETEAYREWFYDGQVAGSVKQWENLDFVTVKGAGHLVPPQKPGQAQKMIYNFINGIPL